MMQMLLALLFIDMYIFGLKHSLFFYYISIISRYGLPVNFQAVILQPYKKTHRRLRDQLFQLYSHLDSSGVSGTTEVSHFIKQIYQQRQVVIKQTLQRWAGHCQHGKCCNTQPQTILSCDHDLRIMVLAHSVQGSRSREWR